MWVAPLPAQQIVAHRGASFQAPENTLAAFRLAWKQDADAIEGDFYLTADEQIVCIHDRTTRRTAPGSPELVVADSTLRQLRQLDVGSWKDPKYAGERIPRLAEVLATVPDGKRIFVEIKCGTEILPHLQGQLERSGLQPEQIVIICFEPAVVEAARGLMPRYRANWLTSYRRNDSSGAWEPSVSAVRATLRQTGATGLGTQGKAEVVDKAFVRAIKGAGLEFHVWTINQSDVARRFAALGVDSITTDKPLQIRRAIRGVSAAGPR